MKPPLMESGDEITIPKEDVTTFPFAICETLFVLSPKTNKKWWPRLKKETNAFITFKVLNEKKS